MLKITRVANGEVVFTVNGRMEAENLVELKTLFSSEASGRRITLDLKELTLAVRCQTSITNAGDLRYL